MDDVQCRRETASESFRRVAPARQPRASAEPLERPRPREGFGRREFAATVFAGGVAVLGIADQASAASYDDPDVVKQTLQEIKDLACDVAVFVTGLPGPLTDPADKNWVEDQIVLAATTGHQLLNKSSSLLYSGPERWLFWMPIDAKGLNLTETSDTACQAACEALYAWCDFIANGTPGKDEEAAKALWQTQNLYCHLFEAAGIV